MRIDRRTAIAGIAAVAAMPARATGTLPSRRPPAADRRFTSPVVEAEIARVKARIGDPEIAWLFENCYPNTLDTTVRMGVVGGKPDAFVITGDIPCLWLRDSAAQLQPYLPLVRHDPLLATLFRGLIARHARSILIDPYANAFMENPQAATTLAWALTDQTTMTPGVAERKWEVDSLCYPVRLAHGYWRETRDRTPFDAMWTEAARATVRTFREQQRKDGPGPYRFQRVDKSPTETLMLDGLGAPTRKVGLIHSMFRPSDDACVYPFLIPVEPVRGDVAAPTRGAGGRDARRHRAGGGCHDARRRGGSGAHRLWADAAAPTDARSGPMRSTGSATPPSWTMPTCAVAVRPRLSRLRRSRRYAVAAHRGRGVERREPVVLPRPRGRGDRRPACRAGADLADVADRARMVRDRRHHDPRRAAHAEADACRHRLHARGVRSGRSRPIHPAVVRLGERHVRRTDRPPRRDASRPAGRARSDADHAADAARLHRHGRAGAVRPRPRHARRPARPTCSSAPAATATPIPAPACRSAWSSSGPTPMSSAGTRVRATTAATARSWASRTRICRGPGSATCSTSSSCPRRGR